MNYRTLLLIGLLVPLPGPAQTTFYWSGAALDPLTGGSGNWNTSNSHWSLASGSYSAASWANGVNHAVLGGSTAGTIAIDAGISGTNLTVETNHTLDTQGNALTFSSLTFAGGGTNLTITGGGTFRAGASAGMVTLLGSGTTLLIDSASLWTGGTIIAKETSRVQGSSLADTVTDAAVQFHDSAALHPSGRTMTVRSISSAAAGAGLIENNSGSAVARVIVNQPSGTETFSGTIRDSSSGPSAFNLAITKDGAGTLVLEGAQKTHTGGTVIAAGTLRTGVANVLPPTGTVTLAAATLDLDSRNQAIGGLVSAVTNSSVTLGSATLHFAGSPAAGATFAGVISGTGALVKTGSGTQNLSGANTFAGGTVVEGGKLTVTNSSALGSGAVEFRAGTTMGLVASSLAKDISFPSGLVIIDPGFTGSRTLSGVLSGAATLQFGGAFTNTFTLTGTNTYSGGTKVSNAAVVIGADSALGASNGAVELNSGVISWSQTFDLAPTRALSVIGSSRFSLGGRTTTIAQAITGTGSLSMETTGTLVLNGTNTFAGGLFTGPGTVVVSGDAGLGASGSPVKIDSGGTLRFSQSAALAVNRNLRLTSGSTGTIAIDDGATVTIPAALTNFTAGTATFAKSGLGTLVLTAAPAHGGSTTVNGGILRLSAGPDPLAAGSAVTVEAGELDFDGNNQTMGSLGGFGNVRADGGILAIDSLSGFSGRFVGAGTVRQTGGGTYTLAGTGEAFTGTFQVEAGTLALFGTLGAGSTLVLASGTTLAGTGGTADNLQLEAGATLAPGSSPGVLSAGATTMEGGVTYAWEINDATGGAGTGWDLLQITGSLTLTATAGNPLTIDALSLDLANAPGAAANFDPAQDYVFPLITTTSGISGFDLAAIDLDLAGFTNGYTGEFAVALANAGKDLVVRYWSMTFDTWSGDEFSPAELADLAISGPNADPDLDGLPNLVEFALGKGPKTVDTTSIPEVSVISTNWAYTYTRPADRDGITYTVEKSTDLTNWTTTGVTHALISSAGGIETWRATFPVASAANCFFRLKVNRP